VRLSSGYLLTDDYIDLARLLGSAQWAKDWHCPAGDAVVFDFLLVDAAGSGSMTIQIHMDRVRRRKVAGRRCAIEAVFVVRTEVSQARCVAPRGARLAVPLPGMHGPVGTHVVAGFAIGGVPDSALPGPGNDQLAPALTIYRLSAHARWTSAVVVASGTAL
jgi:hypothetical protein